MLRRTLLLAVLPAVAAAQTPRITQQGDPSVKPDTIYRLAIPAPEYAEQKTLVLLDDGVVRLERDGRGSSTYRQIIQILAEDAVEDYQEASFSWVPTRQALRVNWYRVVRPDGSVISAEPAQVQDADVPAEINDPVYTDRRVRRLSISGVAVGTIVDYSYTIEDTVAFPPDDQYSTWSVSMGSPVRRSRLILDVPAAITPTIIEENLTFRRRVDRRAGRTIHTWAVADVPRVKAELYAADSNAVTSYIKYALPRRWSDVGAWYAGISADRYALGPGSRAAITNAVAGARTRMDSLVALHKYVAQDIRYVSVSLGTGGYVPRVPDDVVKTQFGDCKDKATLFIAALRSWGIRAHPVLVRTSKTDPRVPSIQQFNHLIAAIEGDSGYQYVDLTASVVPFGELPYGPQGEFAVVVRSDGRMDEVTIPLAPIEANRKVSRLEGELAPDGTFRGWYEESGTGMAATEMRGQLYAPLDSVQQAEVARNIGAGIFPGGQGDSLRLFVGKDLAAPVRIAVFVKGGKAATRAGTTMIMQLPIGNLESMATIADQIEAAGPRRFTIDAEAVLGAYLRETTLRIRLPEGWTAQLPPGVSASSRFGKFVSTYRQEGRDLILTRVLSGARGTFAPETVTELLAWLREMATEDTRFIGLTLPGN